MDIEVWWTSIQAFCLKIRSFKDPFVGYFLAIYAQQQDKEEGEVSDHWRLIIYKNYSTATMYRR